LRCTSTVRELKSDDFLKQRNKRHIREIWEAAHVHSSAAQYLTRCLRKIWLRSMKKLILRNRFFRIWLPLHFYFISLLVFVIITLKANA
jgi:hypothetical protein